jgi:hypothetical protein
MRNTVAENVGSHEIPAGLQAFQLTKHEPTSLTLLRIRF